MQAQSPQECGRLEGVVEFLRNPDYGGLQFVVSHGSCRTMYIVRMRSLARRYAEIDLRSGTYWERVPQESWSSITANRPAKDDFASRGGICLAHCL